MVPAASACADSNMATRIPIGRIRHPSSTAGIERELSTIPPSTQTEARFAFRDNAAARGRDSFRNQKEASMKMTRRSTAMKLLGMTTLGTLLSARGVGAEKDAKPSGARHCLAVYYPWQADAKFDDDYYRDKHLRMLADLYGKSVGKMQVRKGLRKGDGSPPAFVTVLTVEILAMEAYEAASKEHVAKLRADIPNFTNIIPVAQIEEIV
jgi:uncharacterized protein (TIGR02118 family)